MNRPHAQYSLKFTLVGLVAAATTFAWIRSEWARNELSDRLRLRSHRERSQISNLEAQLDTALAEIKAKHRPSWQRRFSSVRFDGMDLTEVKIDGGVFQRASFRGTKLVGAELIGGGSSFQLAVFDEADATGATIIGGGASLQMATFRNTNLRGATVQGNLQSTTFAGADLRDATLIAAAGVGMQRCDLDATDVRGADLSRVPADSLEMAYFETPPKYDDATRFPDGFDPRQAGWQHVASE